MAKKNSRKKRIFSTLKITLFACLLVFAAAFGVYCAKLYTSPYSKESDYFMSGTLEEVEIAKEKCNILIMGTDKSGLLTDVIMIAQIDPIDDSVTVMSIPRDTNIAYPKGDKRINSVHAAAEKNKKGSEAAIIAVRELTGIPIHHYVKINTRAFVDCVDALGGVDFNVPQNMNYEDPAQDLYIHLKKGQQHLDGDKAEQLVRFRSYWNGDIGRIKVQQDFMHALIDQKLQMKYVGKVGDIYSIVSKNIETSLSPEEAMQCAEQILSVGKDNINTIILPHSFVEGKSYVIPINSEIDTVRAEEFGYDKNGDELE